MKPVFLVSILLFSIAALLVFPISKPDSTVFYISAAFLTVALALGSGGKGLKAGIKYIWLERAGKNWLSILGWTAATLFSSLLLTAILSVLLAYFGLLDNQPVLEKLSSLSPLTLLLAFTLAPLAEESLFRGYLFRKISEISSRPSRGQTALGTAAGALVSSLVFAFMHFSYGSAAEIIVAFCLGLLLCFFTRKSGSLLPAVLAHAGFNFLSIMFNVIL